MTVEYLPGALHEKLDFLFPPIKNTSEWNLDPKRFQNGVSRLSHQVPTYMSWKLYSYSSGRDVFYISWKLRERFYFSSIFPKKRSIIQSCNKSDNLDIDNPAVVSSTSTNVN